MNDPAIDPTSRPPMASRPIAGPMAWRGDALVASDNWTYTVTPAQAAELDDALDRTRTTDILQITATDFPLPTLSKILAAMRSNLIEGPGVAKVSGLPMDAYDNEAAVRIYWGIGVHVGRPIPQNRNGHMVGHVTDIGTPTDDPNQRITQSSQGFPHHSDMCDVLSLFCVRPARSGGVTRLVSATTIHDEVMRRRPDLLEVLYRAFYQDRRGEIPEGQEPYFAMPMFAYEDGHLASFCTFPPYVDSAQRFSDVPPLTETQVEARNLVEEIATEDGIGMKIEWRRGDMVFFNNHAVFHARTAYDDYPEQERKRHLMRLWLAVPDSGLPALPVSFSGFYGDMSKDRRPRGIDVPGLEKTVPLNPTDSAYS